MNNFLKFWTCITTISGSHSHTNGKNRQRKIVYAVSVDRTRDLQIFSLTLSQLSYPRYDILQ